MKIKTNTIRWLCAVAFVFYAMGYYSVPGSDIRFDFNTMMEKSLQETFPSPEFMEMSVNEFFPEPSSNNTSTFLVRTILFIPHDRWPLPEDPGIEIGNGVYYKICSIGNNPFPDDPGTSYDWHDRIERLDLFYQYIQDYYTLEFTKFDFPTTVPNLEVDEDGDFCFYAVHGKEHSSESYGGCDWRWYWGDNNGNGYRGDPYDAISSGIPIWSNTFNEINYTAGADIWSQEEKTSIIIMSDCSEYLDPYPGNGGPGWAGLPGGGWQWGWGSLGWGGYCNVSAIILDYIPDNSNGWDDNSCSTEMYHPQTGGRTVYLSGTQASVGTFLSRSIGTYIHESAHNLGLPHASESSVVEATSGVMGQGWQHGVCGVLRTYNYPGCPTCIHPWPQQYSGDSGGFGAFRLSECFYLLKQKYFNPEPYPVDNTNPLAAVSWPRMGTMLRMPGGLGDPFLLVNGADSPRSIIEGSPANASGLYALKVCQNWESLFTPFVLKDYQNSRINGRILFNKPIVPSGSQSSSIQVHAIDNQGCMGASGAFSSRWFLHNDSYNYTIKDIVFVSVSGGNPVYPAGSYYNPYHDIQQAIDYAKGHSCWGVILLPGTYTISSSLQLINFPENDPYYPYRVSIIGYGSADQIVITPASPGTINLITIDGSTDNIMIANLTLKNGAWAVYKQYGGNGWNDGLIFSNVIVANDGGTKRGGINLSNNGCYYGKVHNCTFYQCSTALQLNNLMGTYNWLPQGSEGTAFEVKNNIFSDCTTAMKVTNSDRFVHLGNYGLTYNLFYNCTTCIDGMPSGWSLADYPGTLNGSNPQFVNPGTDFHLQDSSPAIWSGDPLYLDNNGARRRSRGAFEYWGSGPSPTPTPRVITVSPSGNYQTIQQAIDAAFNGDEIVVSQGTYVENIHLNGKNVTLRSTDPFNLSIVGSTIINGNAADSVVTFSGMETSNCILAGFTITNGGNAHSLGGGIRGHGTLATIRNNIIRNNEAYLGGGILWCDGIIQNNIIKGNSTSGQVGACGGGLYDCDGVIQNNTIYGNSALYLGGGLYRCNGYIRNCIVWQNTQSSGAQIQECITPSYCCIQNWTGGGTGNITSDPCLVAPQNGDFHLQCYSLCIDAGGSVSGVTQDYEGDTRPYNAVTWMTRGDGSDYDIGADEFIGQAAVLVPRDYATIQAAIDAASNGWIIVVSSGTYYENLNMRGKNITLRSTDPQSVYVVNTTVIDGDENGSVVTFTGAETSACVLSGFKITKGLSDRGGGIKGNGSSAIIQYNKIVSNKASGVFPAGIGGGLHHCDGIIRYNTISQNWADNDGGGLAFCDNMVDGNTIDQNWSDNTGGGFYQCDGTIRNNTISGNWSDFGGGLIDCDGAIEKNVIQDNKAYVDPPNGGGGGGLFWCDGVIQNNIIWKNQADVHGGGLSYCNAAIRNNVIFDNQADSLGGGLSVCQGTIKNCIIWQNSASSYPELYSCVTPSYCCIQDWTSGGAGNMATDPLMQDPGNGDFHLTKDSPCIDAGGLISGLTSDFEGDIRPFSGIPNARGDYSEFDIGADEFDWLINDEPTHEQSAYPPYEALRIYCGDTVIGSFSRDATPSGLNSCEPNVPDTWYYIEGLPARQGINVFFEDFGDVSDLGFVAIFEDNGGTLHQVACDHTRSSWGRFAAYYVTDAENMRVYINLGSQHIAPNQELKVMCFDKMER